MAERASVATGVAPLGKRYRSVVALVVLTITLTSCSTMPRSEAGGGFTRNFAWQYAGQIYQVALDLHPTTYAAYRQRERTRDYDLFASDYHSKPFIEKVTRKLAEHGRASGLSKAEMQHLIVSFVSIEQRQDIAEGVLKTIVPEPLKELTGNIIHIDRQQKIGSQ